MINMETAQVKEDCERECMEMGMKKGMKKIMIKILTKHSLDETSLWLNMSTDEILEILNC